ncbi:reverse transcriptase, partial [Tanacetum coccineum]
MAPATRTSTNTSMGDGVDPQTKSYVDAAMNEIGQSLAALTSTIAAMGGPNNQLVNPRRQANQFSRLAKWTIHLKGEKLKIMSIHLDDKALLWHRQFVKIIGDNVGWEMYKTAIIQRFRFVFKDPMAALKNAKYEKNAKEYQDVFNTLLSTLEAVKKKNKPIVNHNNSKFSYGSGSGTVSKPPLMTLPSINNYGKGQHELHILVDSGSTHNFLDVHVAKRLGCNTRSTYPLSVSVVRDRQLITRNECKGFQWTLKGETFTTNVMLLPLRGCDMVLGIQWLATLGDIKCNFKELRMQFVYNNKKLCLRGSTKTEVQWMNGRKQIQKMEIAPQGELRMLSVYPNTGLTLMTASLGKKDDDTINDSLEKFIESFKDVFEVPKQLPPARSHNHRIPLLPGTQPINIRPYRHPPVQKDAIESMVKELLESGVIKHSQSSFASPMVMVKKKDNSWRMYVDYRKLNKSTIKDKFPIPIIEELIYELHGAAVFSKLDLRFGYHQIRMSEDDIAK